MYLVKFYAIQPITAAQSVLDDKLENKVQNTHNKPNLRNKVKLLQDSKLLISYKPTQNAERCDSHITCISKKTDSQVDMEMKYDNRLLPQRIKFIVNRSSQKFYKDIGDQLQIILNDAKYELEILRAIDETTNDSINEKTSAIKSSKYSDTDEGVKNRPKSTNLNETPANGSELRKQNELEDRSSLRTCTENITAKQIITEIDDYQKTKQIAYEIYMSQLTNMCIKLISPHAERHSEYLAKNLFERKNETSKECLKIEAEELDTIAADNTVKENKNSIEETSDTDFLQTHEVQDSISSECSELSEEFDSCNLSSNIKP